MGKILLVEDDQSLGETLCERFTKEGHRVTWAQSQVAALEAFSASTGYALVVLDVGLPDGSGFELARAIKAKSDVPFIFMTALNSAEHRLEGYEIGAEEFIPKPFHLKELLLRVRHVLQTHAVDELIRAGDRVIDVMAQAILDADGKKVYLPARDFALLKLLIAATPKILSRDEILDALYGEDKYPNHRSVDNAVVRIRQALGDEGGRMIRSVRGVGYQWAEISEIN